MQRSWPDVSIRVDSSLEPELMRGLIEGRLDIGVMYTPQSRPGLKVEHLFDDRLVMVSTNHQTAAEPQSGYVYIDWGPEFYTRHSASFPDYGGPMLSANIGWLGLQHVLGHGGSGYFPARIVAPHLASGVLHLVESAPHFFMPAYVVFGAGALNAISSGALSAIRDLARTMKGIRQAQQP